MDGPTESDQIRPPAVSDKQSIAIDALTAGCTHREAARLAGVQRSTVTAWCNHNVGSSPNGTADATNDSLQPVNTSTKQQELR